MKKFRYCNREYYGLLVIIILSVGALSVWGQDIYISRLPFNLDSPNINQIDSLGRKQGLWFISGDRILTILSYENDKEAGIARYYTPRDSDHFDLFVIGNYDQGIPSGVWQYFYDNGAPSIIQTQTQLNTCFLEEARWGGFKHPEESIQCYIQLYDDNGKLESEGWAIYIDDLQYDGEYVGEWKYYTQQGCRIENYSKSLKRQYDRSMQD